MKEKPFNILLPETSILIVDDSVDYSQVLRRILQNGMGYESVVTVSSIEEAYTVCRGGCGPGPSAGVPTGRRPRV